MTPARKKTVKQRPRKKQRTRFVPKNTAGHAGTVILPFIIVVVALLGFVSVALFAFSGSLIPRPRPAQTAGPVASNVNRNDGGLKEENGKLCFDYRRGENVIKYCATCGDGSCETAEQCTASAVAADGGATPDCGPLYCLKDCKTPPPNP